MTLTINTTFSILLYFQKDGAPQQCSSALRKQCFWKSHSDPPPKLVLISREVFNKWVRKLQNSICSSIFLLAWPCVPLWKSAHSQNNLEDAWFPKLTSTFKVQSKVGGFHRKNVLFPLFPSQFHLPNLAILMWTLRTHNICSALSLHRNIKSCTELL